MDGTGLFVLVVISGLILLALISLITRQYHRVPPSEVMVVYGRGSQSRMISNGGVFIIPILETYKSLDLTVMTIKQESDEVHTVSGVPIKLDWVAQVQVDSSEVSLQTAARALLDMTREQIRQLISDTLRANFRAIVGQMTVEAIHRDRDSFVQKVQDLAHDDMSAMGIKIISMGIEEITDDQGYLRAMAAPQIAAIKRDAMIAEADADREARVRAASARREAEQAELDSQREILAQRQALSIREVEVEKEVAMARAVSEQEVQQRRALAVEKQQEAEVLVPARARRAAVEIEAEAERRRVVINAEASAEATRTSANASSEATERKGRADAVALQVMKEAEAAGAKAEAEALQARALAEAEGEKAKLLAEAEGRRELAAASAAEGEINLRQFLIEQIMQADIAKMQAIANAMSGLGDNVRIVQFGNSSGGMNGATGNSFMDMLINIPEVAEVFRAKVEALSGEDLESTLRRINSLLGALRGKDDETNGSSRAETGGGREISTSTPPTASL